MRFYIDVTQRFVLLGRSKC